MDANSTTVIEKEQELYDGKDRLRLLVTSVMSSLWLQIIGKKF